MLAKGRKKESGTDHKTLAEPLMRNSVARTSQQPPSGLDGFVPCMHDKW